MMKRKMGIALLAVLMFVGVIAVPVVAAPPIYEEWQLGSFADGTVTISYIINTTNLKTTQFNVVNNTDEPVIVLVRESGEVIWDFLVEGQTTASKSYVLNFKRLPQTDPDDPGSVRYPNNISIGARYPAY